MSCFDQYDQAYIKEQNKLNQAIGQRDYIDKQIEKTQAKLQKMNEDLELYERVVQLLQNAASYARDQAKAQIEDLVTKCLEYVFEKDISFSIEFEELRNNPSAHFYVSSIFEDQEIYTDPQSAHGGGIVDVLSLALRTAFLELNEPVFQGPLILDEPGKHVSADFIFNLGEFIKQSTLNFNRQVIMVTHNNHLAQMGDKTYLVELRGGKSQVSLREEDQPI